MSQPSKYRAVPTDYAGRRYHSAAEASYAATLDLLVRAGDVRRWEPQVAIPLVVDGRRVCTYVADFRVHWADGRCELHEVKGCDTPVWRLKRKLLEATWLQEHPDVHLRVIKATNRSHGRR
jgi:hypothetical protein